jgi:hypothetical protein
MVQTCFAIFGNLSSENRHHESLPPTPCLEVGDFSEKILNSKEADLKQSARPHNTIAHHACKVLDMMDYV